MTTYIQAQFARLEVVPGVPPTQDLRIQITSYGCRTNWLNMTQEQLKAIQEILDVPHGQIQSPVKMMASYIAGRIIENAKDNGEDVATYSTDEEVVILYLNDLAKEVSSLLPAMIKEPK